MPTLDPNEIAADRHIDPLGLDVECCCQADLFFKWAERAARAKHAVDVAKDELERREAALQVECRQKPKSFGIDKVSETAIKAAVQISDRYRQAVEVYYKARKKALLMDAAVSALSMKRSMLETLAKLHGQEYFAGPAIPNDLAAAVQRREAGAARIGVMQKRNAKRVTRRA